MRTSLLSPLLPKHEDGRGDAGAEEDIGRQADDGFEVIVFDQIPADRPFFTAPEQDPVRQNDGHYAVRLEVVKVMQEKGIVSLGLGREAEAGITGIAVFVLWIPLLRIGRIRDHRVEVEGVIGINRVLIVKVRPIVFQGIGVAGDDIAGQNAAHDEVHASEIVGVFFQLLGEVLNIIFVHHVLGDGLADIEQQ